MKAIVLFSMLTTCLASSCKKETVEPDKTQMLVAHGWRTTAHTNTVTQDDVPLVKNSYAQYDACYRDNTMTFQNDNQAMCNTGSLHCIPGEPATFSGHWYLTKDESKLISDNLFPMMGLGFLSTGLEEFELVELSKTALKLKTSRFYYQGNVKVTITDEYTLSAL
ncbi:hypothetical protein KBK19_01700 [Microvirga sp. STR05]|uniref:Lipocalin-like domain-containing protein n=1 Tax=Hymenobacter duratus TaxID=2771356 RepID=A0ABR8JDP3_9BACT|nr:hypothetical protein [Hymenobacter duratus]MBD2713743.1 hypothetical protein [Hymenobacter duratus]MBR7948645.1 hypothetical protein [Microvirga sp. STR05]